MTDNPDNVKVLYGTNGQDLQRVHVVIQAGNIRGLSNSPDEETRQNRFQKVNPFEDGRTHLIDAARKLHLYGSRPICRYLLKEVKSELLPSDDDLVAYTLFEQACAVEVRDFSPAVDAIVKQIEVDERSRGGHSDEPYKQPKENLEEVLKQYDIILSKSKYLSGDKMTMADILHIPGIRALNAQARGVDQSIKISKYHSGNASMADGLSENSKVISALLSGSYPNTKRWWDELDALKVESQLDYSQFRKLQSTV